MVGTLPMQPRHRGRKIYRVLTTAGADFKDMAAIGKVLAQYRKNRITITFAGG